MEKHLKNLKTCHLGERGSKFKDDLVLSVTRARASVSCCDMLLCRKPGAENHNQHRCLCPRRWPLFIFCPESSLICSFLGSLIHVRHIQTEDLGKKYWGKMTFSVRKKKKKTPKVWSHVCVPSPRPFCYEIYVRLSAVRVGKTPANQLWPRGSIETVKVMEQCDLSF